MALDKWEKAHRRELAKIEKQILAIYEAAAAEAASIGMMVGELTDDIFSFDKFPITHDRINKLMTDMHDRMEKVVVDGVNSSWTLANNKNNELARMVLGSAVGHLTQAQYKRYFSNNDTARQAFLARKHKGLGLSDSVWHYTDIYKHEIELGLDVGIRSGVSADVMSRELRQYLQFPDKLFRRVRDEHGMLKLSQAAKQFHPGQGVYRSSYMNARRLAATETNMAYRSADFERYQRMDFIVGIEVHLSQNHTCKGVKGPFIDICDELKGEYPKDFKFTGWHPHCRCFTTTILKTEKEMAEDEKRIMRGLDPLDGSENQVTDVPDGFKQWLSDNENRIGRAHSIPYFLKDNGTITRVPHVLEDGRVVKWNKFELKEFRQPTRQLTPLEIAQQRHAARTPQQIADIQARADARQAVLKDYALTEKRAGNILNMASGWHEVSFVELQTAMDTVANSVVYRKAQMEELKNALKGAIAEIKAQQAAEKALADIIPDVHKWHEQFTLAELQKVKDSIPTFKAGKATKYYVNNFEDLPLAKQKQLLMDEAKYVSDANYFKPHTLHKTWEVAKSAYEKQVALVDEKIAWEATDIKLANIKVYSAANPKSLKIANLIAEAEKIKAAGGSIADVEAKILEAEKIKAKNEASVASHAKIAAQKKAKELADLQQKKVGLEQQKKDLESMIALAKPTNAPGLTKMKDDLKAVEKELKTVDKKIDKLGGNTFADEAYSDARKKAALWDKGDGSKAAKALRGDASQCWLGASEHERDMMYDYTRHYCDVNEPLTMRRYSNPQTRAKFEDKVKAMTDYIERSSLEVDMWFQRGDGSLNVIESMLKFAGDNSLTAAEIANDPQQLVGKVIQQGAFMSAGSQKGKGFVKPVILNIYAPKGTKATYVEPFSAFGRGAGRSWDGKQEFTSFSSEHETLFQRGTKMRVTKVEYRNGTYYIDVDVIGYELKDLKYVPDNYIGY